VEKLILRKHGSSVTYIDSAAFGGARRLGEALARCMRGGAPRDTAETVFLCIGTDRATGDSLGPLVGHKLGGVKRRFEGVHIYGDLESPVHAKNIAQIIRIIYNNHCDPFIVAVDACLGRREHVGYVSLGPGGVLPGAGAGKLLPPVGDVFIMGVVNLCGAGEADALQNTRLGLVMRMADTVADGIARALEAVGQGPEAEY